MASASGYILLNYRSVVQQELRKVVPGRGIGTQNGMVFCSTFSSWLLWLSGCPFIRRWAEGLKLHLCLGYGF